jgi:hypothetical protein
MLLAYPKNVRDDLPPDQINQLKQFVKQLKI